MDVSFYNELIKREYKAKRDAQTGVESFVHPKGKRIFLEDGGFIFRYEVDSLSEERIVEMSEFFALYKKYFKERNIETVLTKGKGIVCHQPIIENLQRFQQINHAHVFSHKEALRELIEQTNRESKYTPINGLFSIGKEGRYLSMLFHELKIAKTIKRKGGIYHHELKEIDASYVRPILIEKGFNVWYDTILDFPKSRSFIR